MNKENIEWLDGWYLHVRTNKLRNRESNEIRNWKIINEWTNEWVNRWLTNT